MRELLRDGLPRCLNCGGFVPDGLTRWCKVVCMMRFLRAHAKDLHELGNVINHRSRCV